MIAITDAVQARELADLETNKHGITRYVARDPDGRRYVATFEEYVFGMPHGSRILYMGKGDAK